MISKNGLVPFLLIILSQLATQVHSVAPECEVEGNGGCVDKKAALPLKIIAIVAILLTSMMGVCFPLVTRSVEALSPERNLFVVVKAFSAGIILGTGFMHVLPDSFEMLSSSCLPEEPWHNFPFTGLVAMFSAIVTLTIDSLATSIYSQKQQKKQGEPEPAMVEAGHSHFHLECQSQVEGMKLLRFRVVAMVST